MQLSSFVLYGLYVFVALVLFLLYFNRRTISVYANRPTFISSVYQQDYKVILHDKKHLASMGISYVFFLSSLFANYLAIHIALIDAGNATTDILLDHLPLINTDFVFTEGALVFVILVTFLLLIRPRTATFTLKSITLLIYTRALFVIMTHLAPYPDHISTDLARFQYFSSGSDLFFSGHTAIPFMLALIFWNVKNLRIFFILCSFVAACAVLFGHMHYTIDVFAAYFITYGVYCIARYCFKTDHQYFKDSCHSE